MAKHKVKREKDLEECRVYIKDVGDERYDILWLENGSVKTIRRRGKVLAQEYAARKQRELDSGGSGESELPFGDAAARLDHTSGGFWLQLLADGALAVANNPKNESARKAYHAIAIGSRAAQKYISPADMTETDAGDTETVDQLEVALPELARRIGEVGRQRLIKALKSG